VAVRTCYDDAMNRCFLMIRILLVLLLATPSIAAQKTDSTGSPQKNPFQKSLQKPTAKPAAPVKPAAPLQDSFVIEPLGKGVYAAIAKTGGKATSNAMFVIGDKYVVAAGAHMTKEVIHDLNAEIAALTPKQTRYFILAHHHPGYTHVDFDFPLDQDVITSWQTWQDLNSEVRKPNYPVIFFNEGLTLKPGGVTVILTNLGRGHSAGDLVTFVPEAGVVFASDLFYVNSIGYMGGGYMREWVLALEFLEQIGAERIIPGTGPVSGVEEVTEFKEFFKDFLTAVLERIDRGDSLETMLKDFDMPKYRSMQGYQQLIKVNLKRAYIELQEEFGR